MRSFETHVLGATYLEKQDALRRFLTARMASAADAEDLMQELYIKVSQLDVRDAIQNPNAFLFRMASNLALDRIRQRRRSAARDGHWLDVSSHMLGDTQIVDAPDPDRAIDAKQKLEKIMAVVAGLSPQCQRVFRLHKLESKTHLEVAAELGISRSAVEKHMMSALKQLAKALMPRKQQE